MTDQAPVAPGPPGSARPDGRRARRTQGERSAATRQALVAASRPLFGAHGFAAVGTEAIVRAAGVTRGAMYHHFPDKAELFAAVLEEVEQDLVQRISAQLVRLTSRGGTSDPVALMRFAGDAWLDVCAEPEVQRIVLVDGPGVLGWDRWREICLRHSVGLVLSLLEMAMDAGAVRRQPVRPLAHILIGAVDEAAMYIAYAEDPVAARAEIGGVLDQLMVAFSDHPR